MPKPIPPANAGLRRSSAAPRPIEPHHTSVTAFVGAMADGPENDPVRVRSFRDVERTFGGLRMPGETPLALHQFFQNGGTVAYVIRVKPTARALIGNVAARTGMHALLDLDPYAFNLLCLPDVSHFASDDRAAAYAAAARLCELQRACVVCDLPASTASAGDAVAWITGPENPRTPNGAIYFPRLNIPDPRGGRRTINVANSGTVAGIIARIDAEKGVWKAPAGAGTNLHQAAPATDVSDDHNRVLNPRGVNAIRTLRSTGTVLWGSRTLCGDDALNHEFKYFAVRRLVLHVEQSVHRGLSWAVFERNDPALWTLIRQEVTEFLHALWQKGALPGLKEEQAFRVQCGVGETMTESDLRSGRLIIRIALAPLKPGEFNLFQIEMQAR